MIKQLEVETNELIAACVRDCVAAGVFEPVDVELIGGLNSARRGTMPS